MSATQVPSSPSPTEGPGPESSEGTPEARPQADRDAGNGPVANEAPPAAPPVANETPRQMPVRSEFTAPAGRESSWIAILTRGWGAGLARGGLAFLAMAALGQALAFAVNLARSPGESIGTAAKLGWLYFGWFHHAAVAARQTSFGGGDTGVTATVGIALMLCTFLAIALLYKGGRAVADGARGGALARVLHGMKVAPAYAIPPFLVSVLVTIDIPIPRNGLVAGSLQMPSGGISWFVLPLLIAAAAGAAGGLRSGRHDLISHDPWGRRAAGALAGGVRMLVIGLVLSFAGLLVLAAIRPAATMTYFRTISGTPSDQTTMNIAHHVLLLPNQSMWLLVPAMGGCDGLSGGGVSATFLCYSKVPTSVSVTPGLASETPVIHAEFAKAPSGYLVFLLVPAVSVILGGRYAARKRARIKGEAIALGAASGVVFAVLVAVGSWLASVSATLSSPVGGLPANASVLIGPAVGTAGLLALAWGVVGGALGGWLGGREFPGKAPLSGLASARPRWGDDAARTRPGS